MEPLTPAQRLITLASALLLLGATGALAYRHFADASLNRYIKKGLPTLDLIVKFRDANGNDLDSAASRIASAEQPPAGNDRCPALIGGDIASPSVAAANRRPNDCPTLAVWYVKKRPIAFTLYFNRGQAFLQWWDNRAEMKTLAGSRFAQGLFFGLLQSLKISSEQLNLTGLKGEFLGQLLRGAIAANAELHYDMAHGQQGWVLSYTRAGGGFAEQALPAMIGLLASNGYRAPALPEPILEMRVGMQHLVLTVYQERVYLAQSLEALLNVLESVQPAAPDAAPLSLVFRAEAVLDNIPPLMSGAPGWEARFDFELRDGKLGALSLPDGPWRNPLRGPIAAGVLASIPHDAFAAAAASFRLPPNLSVDDWRKFADAGPAIASGSDPGGLALVWDFGADSPQGAVGVIIANPTEPAASESYRQYLRDASLASECAGGEVFLAASSAGLLTRMRESCENQSLSVLDWRRGGEKSRLLAAQLLTFINPGVGVRELFLAGGAGDSEDAGEFAPQWRQDYDQAKAVMREDAEKLFATLPIFSYAGQAGDGPIKLEGSTITREAAP